MLARFQHAGVMAVLLLLAGTALAQPGQTNSLDELLQQGQDELTAKERDAAEATFREALESEPENLRAHEGLGQSLYGLGQWQEAIASFKKVLRLAPTNSITRYHLGSCYFRLGDFQHSAAYFQRFLTDNPTNADGHYWLSQSLSCSGDYAAAEAVIREAIALGAAPAGYYDHWGYCLSQLGRYKEAIVTYQKALSLNATDIYALLQLGACYYNSDAYREAVAPLEKYVVARPKDFDGFYYLGHSHFELRQFDQAARVLQKAHELKPDDGLTRLGLFVSYLATGQYVKASRLYPFAYAAGGGFLTFCYVVGLAWMLVISFKTRAKAVPPVIASTLKSGCAPPPLLSDYQAAPPVLPGFILNERAAAGDSRAPMVVSEGDHANAWPGVWFSLGWLVLLIAGGIPWTFLLGLLDPFRGGAAVLVGLGAASLPLIVVAATAFPRQAWGAPFRWLRPFPPAKLLVLSLLGLVGVELFEAGYSQVVEWITHKPFPVQMTVPLIREALQTNPVTLVLSVVFLAPLAEEVLFRGLLFGALSRWLSARWTIILTAVIFALIHMQAIYLLPLFLVGLLCGWARHKSGSLAVPVLLHVLNNGSSLLLLQLFPQST